MRAIDQILSRDTTVIFESTVDPGGKVHALVEEIKVMLKQKEIEKKQNLWLGLFKL